MRVRWWVVPLLVFIAAAAGIGAGRLAIVPSFERDYVVSSDGSVSKATAIMTVRGVKCVDTAETASGQFEGVAGVSHFVAYASRGRVEVTYDPARVRPSELVECIQSPVVDPDSGEISFGVFEVLELDGKKLK